MKRTLTLFAALVLLAVGAAAQKLSYSAVVRNSANELVANQTLTVAISIANSNDGPAVYSETHSGVQTNQNGLLTLVIGDGGSQAGSMSDVTWSTAYITSDYTMPDGAHVTNTVPVTAVPYALSAGNVEGGFEQVNADWNATSGAAQILNKPEIPVVNDGTLTIQKNGQEVGTFTANQAGNTTVNITITPQDIINAVGEMTPEQKSQLCQALNCGGGTPTPPEPTPECPALGATTITPGTNPVAGSTTYLEIETVIDNYNPDLIDPSTAKFVVSYTVENQSDPISTTVENTYVDLIAVGDGIMYYGFEEQQVVTSITVTPYIALTGECASTTPISGVPSTYPNEVISSFTVNNAIISATNGLTCDLELVDANMNHAELSDVTIRVGNSSFTPSVTRMRSINEQYHLSVPYSDIENAGLNLNDDVLEDVQVDFTYGDQTFSAANNNAVEADFAICSSLGATTVATTPATGDVVTFVATVDNSNDNITGKYFTITYMEGSVEQTLTLENSAVEINTDGNLVGHITETAATPLYGKTLTVVPTITLNSPCSNSEGQSLVYNMPGQTPTPGTFTCGDDLTVGTNTYPTVLIGTQCWTKTNMRETVGTQGSESSDTSFTAPYYYVHPTTGEYFYNWSAANQVCPTGWHLPSWEEFNIFLNFLNSRSEYLCDGLVAKAIAAQTGWFLDESTNQCYVNYEPATSNDATGFSALPVGVWHYGVSSHFVLKSKSVGFWTSREDNGVAHGENGYLFSLEYNSGDISYGNNSKLMGFSVRCLLDENSGGGETTQTEPTVTTEPATGVGQTAALLNGTLSNPSNVAITAKGFEWKAVGAGSYTQVSVTGSDMSYTLTGLTASSEYIYRAFVTTASGTSYGQEVTFTTAAPPACPVLGTPTFCKQVGTNTVTIIIRTPIENYDADLISGIIYDYDFVLPGFGGGSIGSGGQSMATVDNVTNVDGNYVCVQQVELSAETWQANQSLMMSYSQTIEFSPNCDGSSSVTYSPDEVEVMAMPTCMTDTCPSLGATGTPGVSNSVFVTVNTAINDYDANKIGLYSYRIYYTDDQYFVKYTDHGASISEAGLKVTFNPSVELPVPYASSVCTLRLVPVLNVICSDTALIGEGVEYVYVPILNCGTMTDADGHTYETVQIGTQCWTKTNLRSTKDRNGNDLTTTAADDASVAHCFVPTADEWSENNSSVTYDASTFGYFYNWEAAKLVCPSGWHLPSHSEWTTLTDYVKAQSAYVCDENAAYIAKVLADTTTAWKSSGDECTPGYAPSSNNATGFSAVPAGGHFDWGFHAFGYDAHFWSFTEYSSSSYAYYRALSYNHAYVGGSYDEKHNGRSVRCLKGDEPSYPSCGTMTDADGHTYETVQIGIQCWTKTNLRSTKDRNGNDLTTTAANDASVAHCFVPTADEWSENNSSVTYDASSFGYFYNWEAAKLVCPSGWHLPTDAEWDVLTSYVIAQSDYRCGAYTINIARALAATTTAWRSSDDECTPGFAPSSNNATGFSAVPAGYHSGSSFFYSSHNADFWSSVAEYNSSNAYYRELLYGNASVYSGSNDKGNGYSVRCLRDA